jgi:hypothetical protein
LALGECQQRSRAVVVTSLHEDLDLVRERDLAFRVVNVRFRYTNGVGQTLRPLCRFVTIRRIAR